jgi:hypothetical protein
MPKEIKLLEEEARIEEITQKRAKMKKKRSYIVPRWSCIVPRCDGYLFEENLRNFGNKSDPIVLRSVLRWRFIVPRWKTQVH